MMATMTSTTLMTATSTMTTAAVSSKTSVEGTKDAAGSVNLERYLSLIIKLEISITSFKKRRY